jgi:hypothetical protein
MHCTILYLHLYPQASEAATDSQGNVVDNDADAADSDSGSEDSTTNDDNDDATDITKESRRAAKKRHEQELQSLLAEEGHIITNNNKDSATGDDGANESIELSNESAVVLDRLTGQPFANDILMHAVSLFETYTRRSGSMRLYKVDMCSGTSQIVFRVVHR